ncbi:MAG TPA: NBR1-Ig-like domain-containing protein [Anaerolineaceae bacterium]|nr:NBR1-Ig-like domain-containing protein [Anaerolineaceae bacterium]
MRALKRFSWLGMMAVVLLLGLTACSLPQPERQAPQAGAPLFVPPTAIPPTPTTESVQAVPQAATPGGPCEDLLSFIADVTIPDGSQVQPGSTLDKRWEVQNSGTCNWNENYRLRLIAGEELGASSEQALTPTRSGTNTVIRIVFTAPLEPGDYRSAWQAHNPDGLPFGDPFFIDFTVIQPEAGVTPTLSP